MADVSVRQARPADARAVASLTVRSWLSQLPAAPVPELEAAAAQWERAIAEPGPNLLLVACAGDLVVGYATAGPSDGPGAEIGELVVGEEHRRAGHGSRLMAAAVDLLRHAGFTSVLTWVGEEDLARQRFLLSAGFAAEPLGRVLDLDGTGAVTIRQQRWSALLA